MGIGLFSHLGCYGHLCTSVCRHVFSSLEYTLRSRIAGFTGDFMILSLEVKMGIKEGNRNKQGTSWVKERYLWGTFLERTGLLNSGPAWMGTDWSACLWPPQIPVLGEKVSTDSPPFTTPVSTNCEGNWEVASVSGCSGRTQRAGQDSRTEICYHTKAVPRVLKRWSSGVRPGNESGHVICYLSKLFNFSWTSLWLSVKLEWFYMAVVEIKWDYILYSTKLCTQRLLSWSMWNCPLLGSSWPTQIAISNCSI